MTIMDSKIFVGVIAEWICCYNHMRSKSDGFKPQPPYAHVGIDPLVDHCNTSPKSESNTWLLQDCPGGIYMGASRLITPGPVVPGVLFKIKKKKFKG